MQASSSSSYPHSTDSNDDNNSISSSISSSLQGNNNQEILEKFRESIKSDATKRSWVFFLHAFMRDRELCEKDNYRYDCLIGDKNDVEAIQKRIINFVIDKKKRGLSGKGIENYLSPLRKFYRVNGVKTIDWELVKEYLPEHVVTPDREYYAEEVIAIEEHLDIRGKVVSGVIRGSGIRKGAEPSITIGDLFPIETKYGKIYKIIVYRGSNEMYTTACTPEVANRIDDYFEFRMRHGEACKQFGKSDHVHEYHDGKEAILKRFRKDEIHLDPDAPLIREDFDKDDRLVAMHPERMSHQNIYDIINKAAIAAGVRIVNKGQPYKRHKVKLTHGLRKLFKKTCRRAKVDPIILERLMDHNNGNPEQRITKLMMVYDPEEWLEMQAEFEKAIPALTITKDAMLEAKLEEAEAKLKDVPTLESLQQQIERLQDALLEKSKESVIKDEEIKRLPPPYVEDADKKDPAEILTELSDKGYGFVPVGDAAEFYTEGIAKKEEYCNEIVKIPPSATKLAAKLDKRKKENENPIY